MLICLWYLVSDVRIQASTQANVDQLQAAADSHERLAILYHSLQELQFQLIAIPLNPIGLGVLKKKKKISGDIPSPGEQHTIQSS